MEIKKLDLKKSFSELENPENHEIGGLNDGSFEDVGRAKIDALKNSIKEINDLILGREILSRQIHSEGESLKTEIQGYLRENEKMQIASSDPAREKNDLRHKKIEISELQMNEKIGCWKDIAILKKELREHERALTEKEDRIKTMNKLMEESE